MRFRSSGDGLPCRVLTSDFLETPAVGTIRVLVQIRHAARSLRGERRLGELVPGGQHQPGGEVLTEAGDLVSEAARGFYESFLSDLHRLGFRPHFVDVADVEERLFR